MPQSAGAPGGKKKKKGRAPAHQNKYAFRHNPKSKKTDKILASPNVGVCRRCHEKIEWRKQYRKYKPLTQPGKCNLCQRRNVKAAYHTICADCAVGDKANRAVLEATTGASGAASGKAEVKPEAATKSVDNTDQQVADETDAVENTSDHGSDGQDESPDSTPRNRRVCEICVKDYALGSLEDDEEGDELAQLEAALEGKLKLREKRVIERKIERLTEERRRNRRKAKEREQQEEEDDGEESGEEDGSNAGENEEHEGQQNEDDEAPQEDTKVDANDDDSGDEVEEEDDPFLKAVGGADKLLTGEAYQKALLEKAGGA